MYAYFKVTWNLLPAAYIVPLLLNHAFFRHYFNKYQHTYYKEQSIPFLSHRRLDLSQGIMLIKLEQTH